MHKSMAELIEWLLIIPLDGKFTTALVLIIIVSFLIAAGLIAYIVARHNGRLGAKNNFENNFSNVDLPLEQRHDANLARKLGYDERAHIEVPEKKKEDVALDLPT